MRYLLVILTALTAVWSYNYDFHGCCLAPDNTTGWVVSIDTNLIIKTTNGGASWQPQTLPPDTILRVLWDVTCFNSFYAWTAGKHYLNAGEIIGTTNGGTNWTIQTAQFAKYATRIEFINQNYGWAACGDGVVLRTTNAGSYWDRIFTPWYSAEYYGISFINQTNGWLVAGWPDSLAAGQGIILKSTDGGLDWDSLFQTTGYEDYLDVYFLSATNGIVVGGNEQNHTPIILKTTNGGATWNSIIAPVNAKYLRAVDFVGNAGWAVGNHGTIIYTSNGGSNWISQTNPADTTLYDVDFSDNLHGLAVGYDIILYTTNGGQNWLASGFGLNVNLVPDAISVPQGGTLGYTTTASNYTSSSVTIQYWVDIYLPNGQPYNGNPIFGPVQFSLGAGASRNRHFNQGIPMSAPLGTYALYGRVGTFPGTILDEDHFHFTVIAPDNYGRGNYYWETVEKDF